MVQLSLFDLPDAPLAVAFPPVTRVAVDDVDGAACEPETTATTAMREQPVWSDPPSDLGDVIARIQSDSTLPPAKIRQWASSVRTFARGVGRPPTSIPATPSGFREALAAANPIIAGIKAKRWANAVADVRRAFEHLSIGDPRTSDDLPVTWARLKDLLPAKTLRRRLSRFIGYCGAEGLVPEAVTANTMTAFHSHLEASPRVREPKKAMRATCIAWNDASRTVEGWPATTVPVPSWSRTYRLPPGALPETFEADLQRLHDRLSVVDLLDEAAPDKPLRPATLATKMAHLRELAAAAVHAGVPAETITGVGALLHPPTLKAALGWLIARKGGRATSGLIEVGQTALSTARHFARLPDAEMEAVERMVRRLGKRERGLTAKNRKRLAAFDDEQLVRKMFGLPTRLDRMADAKAATPDGAVLAQTALLISIWLAAPIRLKNMQTLTVDRHIVRHGSRSAVIVYLQIAAEETKNGAAIEFPLPDHVVERLDRYIAKWRPLLAGFGSPWLLPGRDPAKPKHAVSIADQIKSAIREHLGIAFNPHLFRHLAGKLALSLSPGNYELPRRLLGHKSIDTTTTFYTGTETAAAARLYDDLVLTRVGADVPLTDRRRRSR
jgi:integrase